MIVSFVLWLIMWVYRARRLISCDGFIETRLDRIAKVNRGENWAISRLYRSSWPESAFWPARVPCGALVGFDKVYFAAATSHRLFSIVDSRSFCDLETVFRTYHYAIDKIFCKVFLKDGCWNSWNIESIILFYIIVRCKR